MEGEGDFDGGPEYTPHKLNLRTIISVLVIVKGIVSPASAMGTTMIEVIGTRS